MEVMVTTPCLAVPVTTYLMGTGVMTSYTEVTATTPSMAAAVMINSMVTPVMTIFTAMGCSQAVPEMTTWKAAAC